MHLAGLAIGFFKSPAEVQKFWRAERTFEPNMTEDQRETLVAGVERRGCALPAEIDQRCHFPAGKSPAGKSPCDNAPR